MKIKITLLFIALVIMIQCSKKSNDEVEITSVFPLEVGTTWIYKNLVYSHNDTNCVMDTISIIGKYKDYFIEKTTHANWTGISFVKYIDNKYILYGRILNSDTTFSDKPIVLGFMSGITGEIDPDLLMKNEKLRCKDSLNISIIPEYNVLGKTDTIYSQCYSSVCPSVSHRYDYYSKRYGLVYNKAIRRGEGNIIQEIILEKIYRKRI